MFCPFCNHRESRVLESRLTTENSVRRRRECEGCGKRFTTFEKLEVIQFLVVKRSGIREPYTREKLRAGLSRACAKTTVTAEQIDDLMDNVENELMASGRREVSASMLGETALSALSRLDQVAYVRFASVYRQFRSIEDFIAELTRLKDEEISSSATATVSGGKSKL
ncbi:MAG: transcriptional regulator NrdR [Cyanobacteria bacterium REEB67]|nr:transcriptional regulator NrdR [Cyanobacteria bacterium REEB67]